VAKPDLGTKRLCSGCGAKFYDLNKTPIVCPKCETVLVPAVVTRPRADAAKVVAPVAAAETVVPETADAEFVSLEDAEAEQQGGKKAAGKGAAGDAETDDTGDDDAMEDAAFIEEQEEGADVTDIIGETPIEKEEET
jgi:uncharacterized protein (TIGR02300 family)